MTSAVYCLTVSSVKCVNVESLDNASVLTVSNTFCDVGVFSTCLVVFAVFSCGTGFSTDFCWDALVSFDASTTVLSFVFSAALASPLFPKNKSDPIRIDAVPTVNLLIE